jgi:hypothetical protein
METQNEPSKQPDRETSFLTIVNFAIMILATFSCIDFLLPLVGIHLLRYRFWVILVHIITGILVIIKIEVEKKRKGKGEKIGKRFAFIVIFLGIFILFVSLCVFFVLSM